MVSLQTLGAVAFFVFCGLGMLFLEDAKQRFIAFALAVAGAVGVASLPGLSTLPMQELWAIVRADPVGTTTSAVALSTASLIPVQSIRRSAASLSLSGLVLSLLGYGWIAWLLVLSALCLLGFVAYKSGKAIVQWLREGGLEDAKTARNPKANR